MPDAMPITGSSIGAAGNGLHHRHMGISQRQFQSKRLKQPRGVDAGGHDHDIGRNRAVARFDAGDLCHPRS